jgi:hypothetical protein
MEIGLDARTFIVWLDPGQTTGLASYDLETSTFMSWQYDHDDLERRFVQDLFPLYADRMVIGYEKYIVTSGGPRTSTPKHAIEATTIVWLLAAGADVPVLKPQPSSARKLGSTVMLRRLGWYKPGKVHANDASQHLLSHLLKMRPMPRAIREKLFPGYNPGATIAP